LNESLVLALPKGDCLLVVIEAVLQLTKFAKLKLLQRLLAIAGVRERALRVAHVDVVLVDVMITIITVVLTFHAGKFDNTPHQLYFKLLILLLADPEF